VRDIAAGERAWKARVVEHIRTCHPDIDVFRGPAAQEDHMWEHLDREGRWYPHTTHDPRSPEGPLPTGVRPKKREAG
jgi:hypothetical protein